MKLRKDSIDGLIIAIALIILFFLNRNIWMIVIASILIVGCLSSGTFARKISFYWRKLGMWMGKVISPILLGFVFFIILTPLGVLYRLFKKHKSSSDNSSWKVRNHEFVFDDIKDPW